jgi:class 3 adenylate cyclase
MMTSNLPDIQRFERLAFRKKNVLGLLLKFSRRLLNARLAGVVYGTDHTGENFLPPRKWDRGVVHQLDGTGVAGMGFKWFGPTVIRWIKLSPIRLFATDSRGRQVPSDGVIAHVIRKHGEYYASGIKIMFIDHIPRKELQEAPPGGSLAVTAYDGNQFEVLHDIKVNLDIIHWFKPDNFVSAYIPDYGAIVFNTVNPELFEKSGEEQTYPRELRSRLDRLIWAIETASLAYLGQAKGRRAAKIIWRKERNLRKTFVEMNEKTRELDEMKRHLQAVGAVTSEQLNMTPAIVPNGVFVFMDMVESSHLTTCLTPREFLMILNLCHEITLDTAAAYGCRVDNLFGDAVFLENMDPFDPPGLKKPSGLAERLMIMTMALTSVFAQIHQVKQGRHRMDKQKQVHALVKKQGIDFDFRAGMAYGSTLVGPLGSFHRRIVTAIGKPVNVASRLESTGKKNCIHIENKLLEILNNSLVSKDTPALWQIIASTGNMKPGRTIPFFSFLQHFFDLDPKMVQKMDPVTYKEFSKNTTYLINCVPDRNRIDVCAGI